MDLHQFYIYNGRRFRLPIATLTIHNTIQRVKIRNSNSVYLISCNMPRSPVIRNHVVLQRLFGLLDLPSPCFKNLHCADDTLSLVIIPL